MFCNVSPLDMGQTFLFRNLIIIYHNEKIYNTHFMYDIVNVFFLTFALHYYYSIIKSI